MEVRAIGSATRTSAVLRVSCLFPRGDTMVLTEKEKLCSREFTGVAGACSWFGEKHVLRTDYDLTIKPTHSNVELVEEGAM
jgi:hypothetical protein